MGKVGFIENEQRMNVLLTRAKCAIIGVGHVDTLNNSTAWAKWLKHLPQIQQADQIVLPIVNNSGNNNKKHEKKHVKTNAQPKTNAVMSQNA